MKLETFFEKFDQFADAPDAVAKMRELVLQLAVQGKLVKQDQRDESAGEIIGRARKLTQADPRLAKVLKVYDDKRQGEPIALPELPTGWAWTCNAKLGDTSPRNDALDDTEVAFAPMNRVPTDYRAALEFESRPWGKVKKGFTHFSNGDVAVAKITPCFQNGKACVLANLTGGIGAGTTELHVLRPHPNTVVPLYMLLFFKSPDFVAGGVATFSGTAGQQRVSNDYFRFRPVPLPPLAEQKRIVAKVDELMALCDRLEAQQQERETRHAALARASLARFADAPTPANLPFLFHPSYAIPPADLRKSILTLAVQGKLVPQDPNDEPAEDTLVKVLRTRERQEKSLRIKEPTPVEADAEHTPDLPSGWCYASPDQLTAFHKNALTIGPFGSSLLKSDYTDEGVPLVFVRDIRSESFGGPETRFVTADKADELASHTVRPGDLLITKMGDPPGDTAIYPDSRPPAIITADCIKLTPHSDVVSAEYLRFTIRASQIAEQFAGITLGVAQQKVSLGRFRCIAVPIPPLAEQRRIVAKVEQLMALVDALETQLAASRATAANLLSALVAELTAA